jgi:hypothetical protein
MVMNMQNYVPYSITVFAIILVIYLVIINIFVSILFVTITKKCIIVSQQYMCMVGQNDVDAQFFFFFYVFQDNKLDCHLIVTIQCATCYPHTSLQELDKSSRGPEVLMTVV